MIGSMLAAGLLLAGAESLSIAPAQVAASSRKLCRRDYPTDFMMQGACRRNMEDGAGSFNQVLARRGGDPDFRAALRQCLIDYTTEGYTDFMMAGACARNQEDGWREMQR